MLELYYAIHTRAVRPRWLLEELGVPFELVRVNQDNGELKRPAYLRINPNGKVPALVDGDLAMFESAAICQYLADKYPERSFAPPINTPARGHYYQWMHYGMAAIEPPLWVLFRQSRVPEQQRDAELVEQSREQLRVALGVIDGALSGRDFLLGSQLGAADVMIGSILLVGARLLQDLLADRGNLSAYLARLSERPARLRAISD